MEKRYDIIGDIHGCWDALLRLCDALGYDGAFNHPQGRTLVFVGDLIDRGPDSVGVLRLVIRLVRDGRARLVLGNHDDALLRWLRGGTIPADDLRLRQTIEELQATPDSRTLITEIRALLENASLVLMLDGGKLIVVHAGLEANMIGKPATAEMRRFILNGDAIGKSPEGKTLRRDWAASYHGPAFIVYGHTPQGRAELHTFSVNIDTGAVRGGLLTALRWPERALVSVPGNVLVPP